MKGKISKSPSYLVRNPYTYCFRMIVPMEPHVKILRDFRDRFMLGNTIGKGFVCFYYTYSPPIANFIAKHDGLRAMVRISLLPVVGLSWIALKIGPVSTAALMLIFISLIIGPVWFRWRKRE
jgi:hypothetical protein